MWCSIICKRLPEGILAKKNLWGTDRLGSPLVNPLGDLVKFQQIIMFPVPIIVFGRPPFSDNLGNHIIPTWWLIPLSKWVITPVISGLTLLIPFITGVITHLLSGMNHQISLLSFFEQVNLHLLVESLSFLCFVIIVGSIPSNSRHVWTTRPCFIINVMTITYSY